ncbi:putative AP-1 complex subunit mu-2-like protein, partial [Naja naja]
VNANGSVLLSEIVGSIKLKVFLSGMPELRLGLNDRVLFELTGRNFEINAFFCSFSPHPHPNKVKPLIWIESVIEKFSHSRVEIMVKIINFGHI